MYMSAINGLWLQQASPLPKTSRWAPFKLPEICAVQTAGHFPLSLSAAVIFNSSAALQETRAVVAVEVVGVVVAAAVVVVDLLSHHHLSPETPLSP